MINFNPNDLKEFLDIKTKQYNTFAFIESDPISIPHLFSKKEDIEISSFLTATIAWGQRKTILSHMKELLSAMDNAPYEFIKKCTKNDLARFSNFVHRTFNGVDCMYFIKALQQIYLHHGGLESIFSTYTKKENTNFAISLHHFKKIFFSGPYPLRTQKHIADPLQNSSAKRLCMFLRWMVRKDKAGIDFGIWNHLGTYRLSCPLDVHSGRVARKLGLLNRTQNDWKAVCELTENLKKFDAIDPVKYDFALFGLGVNEKF